MLRGDNIEEGHYVERLWAALLSPPVDASTGAAALSHANAFFWLGRLQGCARRQYNHEPSTARV
eukprot:scaffold79586_cov57-Phaeocystis_antarctica.AAC.1